MDVSENSGTPKSSILIGFSIINHPFWGTSIFGNTHICVHNQKDTSIDGSLPIARSTSEVSTRITKSTQRLATWATRPPKFRSLEKSSTSRLKGFMRCRGYGDVVPRRIALFIFFFLFGVFSFWGRGLQGVALDPSAPNFARRAAALALFRIMRLRSWEPMNFGGCWGRKMEAWKLKVFNDFMGEKCCNFLRSWSSETVVPI